MLIVLIVVIVFGFWFGSKLVLDTDYPMLAVASGSMSTAQPDDGWLLPFTPTLHTGDLIIVQAVNPQDIYAAPYNQSGRSGDILVFHDPNSGELIVHRAIAWYDNTTVITKGDGNQDPGPPFPTGRVPVSLIVGKVVFRIPWIGHLSLFSHDQTIIYLILAVIVVIIAVDLLLSTVSGKKAQSSKDEN